VFTYGSTVEYTCDTGYTLVGSKQRVCQANQTWNGTSPLCTSRFGSFILINEVNNCYGEEVKKDQVRWWAKMAANLNVCENQYFFT